MNCREFTAEFEERANALSQSAQLHVNDCPDCVKTSGRQTRVWQMIDDLARIEAPNDFDFRVKAKIAGAKPADFQARLLPVLRYALPICLVAAVLGLLIFNTSFYFGNNSATEISREVIPQTSEKAIAPNGGGGSSNSFSSDQIAADTPGEMSASNIENAGVLPIENRRKEPLVAVKLPSKPRTAAPKKNVEDNFVGVRDLALSRPAEKFPVGIIPNQTIVTLPNKSDSVSISGEEILQFLGIEAVRESAKLKVKTVRENSPAGRSGVRAGDIIEAIDGVKVSAQPIRAKLIEVKKLTVARGAEKIEITLKN